MPKPIHRPDYEVVRSLLRELRLAVGMKQSELSAALGQPQPYISAIETGHRRVDLVEIRDICAVLGVSLSTFVGRLERRLREPEKRARTKRTRIG
jgi:transcriptional regulator with XRE-family HTH domain